MVVQRAARGPAQPTARRVLERWEYPETDVKAMPGGRRHHHFVTLLFLIIEAFYRSNPHVLVGSEMMVYYVPNNRRRFFSPDVFVALTTPASLDHNTHLLWEDGPIHWVLEVLSATTWKKDLTAKLRLYARLGIPEYVVFDPEGVSGQPMLQAWRLVGGVYAPIHPDAAGRLALDVLGLAISVEDGIPCLYRQDTGAPLLLPEDAQRVRAELAEQLAAQAGQRAAMAEQAALQQQARAEAAEQTAVQERARADALAAQLAELRQRLGEQA